MNLIYTIFTVLCLGIGFYFGYKLGDKKELPQVNPIKLADKLKTDVTNIKRKNEQTKELNNLNKILGNINRFDGTGEGQEPIKK